MKIAVLGSGAMGSLYGGLLSRADCDVTLIDIWDDHVQTIRNDGLSIETPDGSHWRIKMDATTDAATVDDVDLVIVFVKSTQTAEAVAEAEYLFTGADVLTLQNGLGNPEAIAETVPEDRVIAGVTSHGSTLRGPGRIRHAGQGKTTIGRYFTSNDDTVHSVSQALTAAGIVTDTSDDVTTHIWKKVLVNVGINAVTALARVKNGHLANTDSGTELATAAVQEAAAVANAEGHAIGDAAESHVLSVAEQTAANRSSMLQDIEADQQTEIETLNGEIVRRGERHGIETPINRTLTNLVRLAETSDS